ncbi:MAG TPA: AAA family ATPase [Anaerolineae bacterium]|jgi:AAA+ superfamily predicted ATPase|nr:AAA family ATPase [Anaerolineae bacterium]
MPELHSATQAPTPLQLNARDLEQELAWFSRVLDARIKSYFAQEESPKEIDLTPPDLGSSESPYASFARHYQLSFPERTAIILALTPHIRPRLLDIFFIKNKNFDRKFTEFGGIFGGPDGDFTPTGETLAFILAGDDLTIRFGLQGLFDGEHFFARHNILRLTPSGDEPAMKAPLRLSDETLSYFTTGEPRRPDFGANFPARFIETQLSWDDLVLQNGTRKQIEEIKTWVEHGQTLMEDWDMARKLRPGYRSLFYGPPGTGKTMTACLLGKSTGRDVYKVDLSLIVSKYIGETEKNLGKVFDQAQNKGWILFFDEADALFGKRSETKDSHDRYANQEVSFLLQRIETFDGIAILASNRRENLDDAFARRFESIIYFPIPRPEERLRLWQQGFSKQSQLDQALDLEKISHEHTLAGGSIMNVIRYASLEALKNERTMIASEDVLQGIRREYAKEGKSG